MVGLKAQPMQLMSLMLRNAVASMAGADNLVSALVQPAGFLPPSVTAALGPISMILSAPSIMKSISSLAKGGAAGTYERIQGEFDLKDGKFAVGGGVRGADTNRSFGDKYAQETMNSGVSMANSLVDDYGFEIDQQALNAAPENIMRPANQWILSCAVERNMALLSALLILLLSCCKMEFLNQQKIHHLRFLLLMKPLHRL
jgi:hypothetical protein